MGMEGNEMKAKALFPRFPHTAYTLLSKFELY